MTLNTRSRNPQKVSAANMIFNSTQQAILDIFRTSKAKSTSIQKRQVQRLSEIISYARLNSPFYSELYAKLPKKKTDLSILPWVTKQQIRKNFDEVCTDHSIKRRIVEEFIANPQNIGKPFLEKYFVCTTAGTTGRPDIFLSDSFTRDVSTALPRIRGGLNNWYGTFGILRFLLSGGRYALLDIPGGPYSGLAAIEWYRREHPQSVEKIKFISIFENLKRQVAELNKFKPAGLGGYPSSLLLLAREKMAGRLSIKPLFIIFVGECVTSANRHFIEEAFGCHCFEEYGSTENNVMAVECKKGWLHYSSDWFVIEPVARDYSPIKAGEISATILVTNLMNKLMPLIRYDQGDSVLFRPGPCTCGSAFPALRIIGRQAEQLKLLNKDGKPVLVAANHLISLIEEIHGVLRIQIVEKDQTTLAIRILTLPEVEIKNSWGRLCERIFHYFEMLGLGEIKLILLEEAPKQNLRSGKYSLVIKEEENLAAEAASNTSTMH